MWQVIRHYHGHLSGVYCMGLHPTLDVLMTGGRDATCRVCHVTSCLSSRRVCSRARARAAVRKALRLAPSRL